MKRRLLTGGCGFIGAHLTEQYLQQFPKDLLVNLDALTYAGDKARIDINLQKAAGKNYRFVHGNICNKQLVAKLFDRFQFDEVIHMAAESHVDNSITGPRVFIETNVNGTLNLLEAALQQWKKVKSFQKMKRFLFVSTDEVYGSREKGFFTEKDVLRPSSPYAASKAAADLLVMAYFVTYGMPVLISRCSNNFGPYQNSEKLIPHMISCALQNKKLPVYGDGKNVRDWIFVKDHCCALQTILQKGIPGQIYNISDRNEWKNLDLVHLLLRHLGKPKSLIQFVEDRLGHDRRYAIDSKKIRRELGWKPQADFEKHFKATVDWFKRQKISKTK